MGRVGVYFGAVFLGLGLPLGALMGFGLLGPPPYVLETTALGPEWFASRESPQGGTIRVSAHADADATRAASRALLSRIETSQRANLSGVTRYVERATGRAGIVLTFDTHLVHLSAPDRAALEQHLESLPFLLPNPTPNPVDVMFDQHLATFAWGAAGYMMLYALLMLRGAAWAARLPAHPGRVALDAEQLRARFLALDDLEQPVTVRPGRGDRLVVEWRPADARWRGPAHVGGMKKRVQLELDFDSRQHRVRVVQTSRVVTWGAGALGFLGRHGWSRGIDFGRFEADRLYGVFHDPERGWQLRDAYRYSYSNAELKAPLIAAVRDAGWSWSPVITFNRLIGG